MVLFSDLRKIYYTTFEPSTLLYWLVLSAKIGYLASKLSAEKATGVPKIFERWGGHVQISAQFQTEEENKKSHDWWKTGLISCLINRSTNCIELMPWTEVAKLKSMFIALTIRRGSRKFFRRKPENFEIFFIKKNGYDDSLHTAFIWRYYGIYMLYKM